MRNPIRQRGAGYPAAAIVLLAALFSSMLPACDEEPPVVIEQPGYPGQLRMAVEYRSSFELGMRCGSADTARPIVLRIHCEPRNLTFSFTLFGADTIVVLRGMRKATNYHISLARREGGTTRDSLPPVEVSTLGLSARGFRWEEFRIGEPPSIMNDVWVANDSCILAAGMGMGDPSLGPAKLTELARWDGRRWHTERTYDFGGELTAVFGFSESDIWVANSHAFHYDGKKWTNVSKQFGAYAQWYFRDIWGDRPDNVWFVGARGSIMHWDGVKLTTMNRGPDVTFYSVAGSGDSVAYAVSWFYPPYTGHLWRYRRGVWSVWMTLEGRNQTEANMKYHMKTFLIHGGALWCDETGDLLVGGKYLYSWHAERWRMVEALEGNEISYQPPYHGINSISGNNSADYVMLAGYGMVYHYNGQDFSLERGYWNPADPHAWVGAHISMSGNTVCVGATISDPINRAFVVVGRR